MWSGKHTWEALRPEWNSSGFCCTSQINCYETKLSQIGESMWSGMFRTRVMGVSRKDLTRSARQEIFPY